MAVVINGGNGGGGGGSGSGGGGVEKAAPIDSRQGAGERVVIVMGWAVAAVVVVH